MLKAKHGRKYLSDLRRLRENGKDTSKLDTLIDMLLEGKRLPECYRDHQLKGDLRNYRDAHIEPDWLLIYRVVGKHLLLMRTGTHEEVFRKFRN